MLVKEAIGYIKAEQGLNYGWQTTNANIKIEQSLNYGWQTVWSI